MASGLALQMRSRIKRIMLQRGETSAHTHVPWNFATTFPQLISGCALDCNIVDNEKTRILGPGALSWDPQALPPLLYHHGPPAGRILKLHWLGNLLLCDCWCGHPEARRCGAFSAAVTVLAYELRETDTANWHMCVTRSWLEEVSLVTDPCNANSVVHTRTTAGPSPLDAEFLTEEAING
jgi:hypothetical protein